LFSIHYTAKLQPLPFFTKKTPLFFEANGVSRSQLIMPS
jgi:hypothetical protein